MARELRLDGSLDKLLTKLAHAMAKQVVLPKGFEVVVQHAGVVNSEEVGNQLWKGSAARRSISRCG